MRLWNIDKVDTKFGTHKPNVILLLPIIYNLFEISLWLVAGFAGL